MTGAGGRSGDLWAVTAYFNPMRSRRRRANYAAFRARLGVPLVAVELAYGPAFELDETEAEILIRLRGRDVMWQKERLLNVALKHVPEACGKVVWMDCDVMFETADWPERLSRLLDRVVLVQAFSRVHHLGPDWTPAAAKPSSLFAQPSVVAEMARKWPGPHDLPNAVPTGPGSTNKGLAWAARRELVERHGFYDAGIVGGGDLALASAAYGAFGAAMRTMNDRQREHYLPWAEAWREALDAEPGCLDGTVLHLWHGDVRDRRYRERHEGLTRWEFDPFRDIAHEGGGWRWNSDKPALHGYVADYFASRRDDG